jgi:hypothetical protein
MGARRISSGDFPMGMKSFSPGLRMERSDMACRRTVPKDAGNLPRIWSLDIANAAMVQKSNSP